ncbi:MAG: carboxymuconolactone decarboxylase family protein [Chloroflexota bacterium]
MSEQQDTRRARGVERLAQLDDQPGGEFFLARMGDLGDYIVDFAFGDVHCRPGLSIEERELIIVALLTSLGGCESQVQSHIRALRAIDVTYDKIEEVIIQTVPYVGVARAANAMKVLRAEQEHQD